VSLVPLSRAGPTPLALRSCVPPVVANERLSFILPSPSLSLLPAAWTGPGRSSRMAWQEWRGSKVSGSLVFRFLVAFFFRVNTVLEGVNEHS
jgi:hypothetical protein